MGKVIFLEQNKKEKKIVFNKKIDDAINGYSVGLTFALVSVLIFYKADYFVIPQISYIVGSLFGILGVLICGNELSKSIKPKGIDNLIYGVIFLLIWGVIYYFFNNIVWLNVLILFFLVFGCYGTIRGCIEFIFSIFSSISEKSAENGKTTIFKNIFLFLTQVFGLVLTVLNILKMLGILNGNGE